MKKQWLILKLCIYYIIGLISFTLIAYITYITLTSILFEAIIIPLQEIRNMPRTLLYFSPWYLTAYTLLYFSILYAIRKYDRYIVNKLNEKLEKTKGDDKNDKR